MTIAIPEIACQSDISLAKFVISFPYRKEQAIHGKSIKYITIWQITARSEQISCQLQACNSAPFDTPLLCRKYHHHHHHHHHWS
ncbi:Tensin [Trichinella spiralis]|uniref:Tensin n=1 Tax=Trichinella spiralis TaxID=6334 RepID=A0ABR3KG48_TRISP